MYEVLFYADKNGNQPVLEYIKELAKKGSKDARIKLNKINDYIQLLSSQGTRIGEPFVKHIKGDIWELRPLDNRIFCWMGRKKICFAPCVSEKDKENASSRNKAGRIRV